MFRSKIPFWFIALCAISISSLAGCSPSSSPSDSGDDTEDDGGPGDDDGGGGEPLTAILDGVEVPIPNPLDPDDLPAPEDPTGPTNGQITAATETWDPVSGTAIDDLLAIEQAADLNAGEVAALPDYFATPVPPNPAE